MSRQYCGDPVSQFMQRHWLAVIQKENNRLASGQYGFRKHTLRFSQVHRGAIADVVSTPRLTPQQNVFPQRKYHEIRLFGNFHRFSNQPLVVLQGRKLNFIDVAPVRIGITCIIECNFAPLCMHYFGSIAETAAETFQQRHGLRGAA